MEREPIDHVKPFVDKLQADGVDRLDLATDLMAWGMTVASLVEGREAMAERMAGLVESLRREVGATDTETAHGALSRAIETMQAADVPEERSIELFLSFVLVWAQGKVGRDGVRMHLAELVDKLGHPARSGMVSTTH